MDHAPSLSVAPTLPLHPRRDRSTSGRRSSPVRVEMPSTTTAHKPLLKASSRFSRLRNDLHRPLKESATAAAAGATGVDSNCRGRFSVSTIDVLLDTRSAVDSDCGSLSPIQPMPTRSSALRQSSPATAHLRKQVTIEEPPAHERQSLQTPPSTPTNSLPLDSSIDASTVPIESTFVEGASPNEKSIADILETTKDDEDKVFIISFVLHVRLRCVMTTL